MSTKCKLSNSYEDAKKYFEWLINLGVFEKIYITGSRSPLRSKQPHKHSDWDFNGLTKIKNLVIVRPRAGQIHADLGIVYSEDELHPKAVEIYPNDKYGVFKC